MVVESHLILLDNIKLFNPRDGPECWVFYAADIRNIYSLF